MNWPHFTEEKMMCRCGCRRCEMDEDFMDLLGIHRANCDFPFPEKSGYRCSAHDELESTSNTPGSGPHTTGKAVDIGARGERKYDIVIGSVITALIRASLLPEDCFDEALEAVKDRGFTGIGVYSWGIHLDCLTNDERPRPRIWGG